MIYPVILSGGAGTRLWPLSRALHPKQLLALTGAKTMLQETVSRVKGDDFAPPLIICNSEHRFIAAQQLRDENVKPLAIILEPEGRNTAPAAAMAAFFLALHDPGAVMLLLPSDHTILDNNSFQAAINLAGKAARLGNLVTFGTTPSRPETGYGYIKRASESSMLPGCHKIECFVEKPDLGTAENYLASGQYLWNSGIFMFPASRYLQELKEFAPDIYAASEEAFTKRVNDLDFSRLEAESFALVPSRSIDHAVMEHTKSGVVIPVEMGWSDVGSWQALWEISPQDQAGNSVQGDVMAYDCEGSYLRSEDKLLAAVGVKDLVVINTNDAVLVIDKNKAQDVRKITDALKAQNRREHKEPARVYRPWGYYQGIDHGPRFQVKHICVNPGAGLSLQMHHHRAEHWVVVEGTAKVTCDGEVRLLHENQSTYIPIGVLHRLENPGKLPLRLIEVQSGAYLGEDDIVRFDDTYGRN